MILKVNLHKGDTPMYHCYLPFFPKPSSLVTHISPQLGEESDKHYSWPKQYDTALPGHRDAKPLSGKMCY